MAIISDTISFSLSHFYHTLSQDIHFFFLREIKGPVCRTNGLIFSKLTTSSRKHPGVERTDIQMFMEPTSGCTDMEDGGVEDFFRPVLTKKVLTSGCKGL